MTMAQTIYASFGSIDQGEKAAGALLDHGVDKRNLTLVGSGTDRQSSWSETREGVVSQEYLVTPNTYYGGSTLSEPPAFISSPIEAETIVEVDNSDTRTYGDIASNHDVNADDYSKPDSVAMNGITTTTAADAGAGAVAGTEVGLGLGVLAGIASLVVPGVGLVIGGGALALAIAAAVSTTVAGAAVGGLVGYLKDQGVTDVDATRLGQSVGTGGAILALTIPSNGVDLAEAELVLNKYGATEITAY
jgi:hypothetical protein